MASIPTPRSYLQIFGDLQDAFLAEQDLPGLPTGDPIKSLLEAAAQSDLRSSEDIFGLLSAISLDKARGLALVRIGQEDNVEKLVEAPAVGTVEIADTSFTKRATKVFQGLPAPVLGAFTLYVQDASQWPASGSLYIGRGTSNYEGPLTWSSKTNVGTYWQLTLSQPITKLHNVGESVILAQGGNRAIGESTIVKTSQGNVSDAVEFRVVYGATIPDGETTVIGVVVACQKPGVIGNVPARAINQFSSEPFAGATVTNALGFSNGRDTEDDDSYRERIRDAKQSKTKGTALSVQTGVNGIGSPDESKRVTSANIVTRTGYPTTLYIDDGTGYEELIAGAAVEVLVDSAIGGEEFFQAKRKPIAKAFLASRNQAPFLLEAGMELKVRVGGSVSSHRFDSTQFVSIDSASAYEVVSAINADPNLGFLARTSDSGTRVVLFARTDSNEDIELVGNGTKDAFRFPGGAAYTTQLYKNERLLTKDGLKAVYLSGVFSAWDTITGSQTISIAVDGTPAITYTFTDQDFIDGNTGYTTVANNDLVAWATVINRKIPGITATVNDGRLILTSNAGVATSASIEITGGALVAVRMFDTGLVKGQAKDYELNRNTSQIRLAVPLAAGDRLSIGSSQTRSFVESTTIAPVTTVSNCNLWFSVDGDAKRTALGMSSANPLAIAIAGIYEGGHLLKLSTNVPAFLNVREGDWMISYDSALNASLRGNFRVAEVERDDTSGEVIGTWITVERKTALVAREGHRTVALAPAGGLISKVLTIGGCTRAHETDLANPSFSAEGVVSSCEIYDPNTGLSTVASSMTTPRAYHTATLLANGKVLVAGGISTNGTLLSSTELYDPTNDTWASGPSLTAAVSHHCATKLATNDVHFCGGYLGQNSSFVPLVSTMSCRYNAGANTITAASALLGGRANHRSVLLADGRVLIAGGISGTTVLKTCEIYNNAAPSFASVAPMTVARREFAISIVGSTPVVAGNFRGLQNATTYETYNVAGNAWTLGQLSSSKYIFCECHDVLPAAGSSRYAMNCWYWSSDGIQTPVALSWNGTVWAELAANPLNLESYTYRGKQWVEIHTADLVTQGKLIGVGGYDAADEIVAQVEWFSTNSSPEWPTDKLDSAVTTLDINLSSPVGLVFVRSSEPLQHLVLPSGANYTATSLASFLNAGLVGATAMVHKTNRLRVATNSHGLNGDIALAAADPTATTAFDITPADAVNNLVGHMASVESGNSEAGTPTFEQVEVLGLARENDVSFAAAAAVSVPSVGGGHQLVGLRNEWTGPPNRPHTKFGSNLNARLHSGFVNDGKGLADSSQIDIRNAAPSGNIFAHDRFYLGAPYAIGPNDDLIVQVDNDLNKRYSIPMWRKLKPATTVYGLTNTFKDLDAGNVSLATTFGLNYSFDDCTVYMKARALAFSGDANRKVLFRFYRLGPDGEYTKVRFSNPESDTASLAVKTDNKGLESLVRIKLPSGAARTPSIRSTTRLGYACTAQTGSVGTLVFAVGFATVLAERVDASDQTRLRLQLPPGVTDCGVLAGSVIYLQSTNGGFASNGYVVNSKLASTGPGGTQDVYVADLTVGDLLVASSIGTVSLDSQGQCLFSGAGIVVGDYFRATQDTAIAPTFKENTFRITAVAAQHVICTSGEAVFGAGDVNAAMTDSAINDVDYVKIFAAAPPTISSIVSTVNALAATDNSIVPITLTTLSSGTGTVDRSTPEELLSQAWYELSDGINWISKTTSPVNTSGNYDLSFKKDVTGSLGVNSDWANEEVRICPTTTSNIVKWLNTPAVSGLYASCSIQASADGAKVQITSRLPGSAGAVQVQGGLANAASAEIKGDTVDQDGKGVSIISRSLSGGFTSGMWVGIDNTFAVPKIGIINSGTTLQSWTADGLVTLNQPVFTTWLRPGNATLMFEKQGDFVAISVPGVDQPRFKTKSLARDTISGIHTLTVLVPDGMNSTGWEAGDRISVEASTLREIVRAQSVLAGNYFLDLLLKDGETALDYLTSDTFQVVSNHASFPSGTYTVVSQVTQANGTVRVQCTHATIPAGNLTVNYSIGTAERADADFGSLDVDVLSVGPYDVINKTVAITYLDSAPSNLTRNWLGYAHRNLSWGPMLEGDLLVIGAPATSVNARESVPAQNQGMFRVVRVVTEAEVPNRAGTVWIENPNVVEGTFFSRAAAYEYHSIMPGDILTVNTSLWGAENRGNWIVEKTGIATAESATQFVNPNTFKVSLADRSPRTTGNPGALGGQSGLVQIIEGKPARLIKRIDGISPNQNDGTFVDIRWDNNNHLQQISAQSGSVVSALDKLAFSTNLAGGVDGYSYNKGLIAEANRIVYGDPADTSAYPGIAAIGSQINISGPLVRRLKLAFQVRIRTGSSPNDIASRVRSAIAAAVNQVGVGKPLSLSAIVAAAMKVVGVVSITPVSPSFDIENDLIAVQPYEKALIVNQEQDISITFAGA